MRYLLWKMSGDVFFYIAVYEVAFGDGKHSLLGQKLRVVHFEFVQKGLVCTRNILFFNAYHEQEHGIALDVSQEPDSYTFSFMGALDNARYIRHYE